MTDVHRQARPTLGASAGFVVAAALAALVPHDTGAWLPLHLLLVGALLTAISGATQLLAVTWSTAPAPDPRLAVAQRWSIVVGAAAVAGGREVGWPAVTGGGAVLVAVGLVILAVVLLGVRRRSATDRFWPAIDTYVAAVGFGLVGVALGSAVAVGDAGDWWVRFRGAHLAANVLGLVGLVIAGTLPFFVATQVRMKMSGRATPGRLRAQAAVLVLATAVTAAGHLVQRPGLVATGLFAYALGLVVVAGSLPVPGRRQLDWAGARLVQLVLGLAWWFAMVVVLGFAAVADGPAEGPLLRALAIGGFAQILVASLAYFGPVLRGGGHERLSAGFATTGSWVGVFAANLAAIALLAQFDAFAAGAVAVWALDTVARGARLVRPGR